MDDDMVSVPDDLWQEANEHTSRGNFDKAIEIYKYILIRYGANNLANEYANARLGDILFMLGQTDLAEDHLRKALSYNPENPDYHRTLGVIYYTRYEWENAVKEYRVALEKEPWNGTYLLALGKAVFNSGDKKTGLEYLHKAEPFYSDNSGFLAELATAYMSLGDIGNARLYAGKAVAIRPDDIMAWAVLKKTYVLGSGASNATTS